VDVICFLTRSNYPSGDLNNKRSAALNAVLWTQADIQVTCNKNPTYENSLWYIETNNHAQRKLSIPDGLIKLTFSRIRRT
jgi:hypothetical protein